MSEKTYHTEREKLLEEIRDIFNGKILSIILSGASLIVLIKILTINRAITGYAIGESTSSSSGSFVYFILLFFSLGLLIFINRHKIELGIKKINERLKKKYIRNSIKHLVGKKVYSENGHYIGKVNEIILGENSIASLKIKVDKKHRFKAKGILVSYRQVKNVGEAMIIDKNVLEKINFLKD